MAPEIICSQNYCAYKADIWSLGVLLFECTQGERPFDDKDINLQVKKITSGKVGFAG
jgi:serine/threonine protein kinase